MNLNSLKMLMRNWFWPLLLAFSVALFIRGFLITPLEITGNSMAPTIHNKDQVLIRHYGTIKRFEIVTFKLPNGKTYIKRVIGLPGDKIEYKNSILYVNQKKVPESFYKQGYTPDTADFSLTDFSTLTKVPAKNYFVLGDNRRISEDSRTLGMIKEEWIQGRALIIYWPLRDFKVL